MTGLAEGRGPVLTKGMCQDRGWGSGKLAFLSGTALSPSPECCCVCVMPGPGVHLAPQGTAKGRAQGILTDTSSGMGFRGEDILKTEI